MRKILKETTTTYKDLEKKQKTVKTKQDECKNSRYNERNPGQPQQYKNLEKNNKRNKNDPQRTKKLTTNKQQQTNKTQHNRTKNEEKTQKTHTEITQHPTTNNR